MARPERTLHMIGSTHIDLVWLWPWQEAYQEARATFWSVIHRMEEYPDFVFTCDQVVLLSWVEQSDPELFAKIRERVADGRWQMVGGWWVEPDCNMPTGESFVRQGLIGQRWLHDRFGVHADVGMNVDPFGHNAMLPAILRGQGMDSYCFMRPGPHESALDQTVFWWEAPDGSRVLSYRIPFEYCSPPGPVDGQVEKSLGQLDRDLGHMMVFYGVGNHGGGPTKANIDSIHRFDRMGSFGRLVMSSPRRYFDEFCAEKGAEKVAQLPVWRSDLQMHAAGCYSAHSGIKVWQRRAQAAVLTAERWAAVAATVHGMEVPRADLERAWQQVLFNQFHDVLPGSAIEHAYDDARDQLGEVISISKRITTQVHNTIARQVEVPLEVGTQPILVFNPHPWPVTVPVEMQYGSQRNGVHVVDAWGQPTTHQKCPPAASTDDGGRAATVFEAEVPALGYRLYRMRPGPAPTAQGVGAGNAPVLRASATTLENDLLRVEVDPSTGWLSSLVDKRTGIDLLAGARGEHTQICQDPTDTWGHRVVSYAWPGKPMRPVRTMLREVGPLQATLRVELAWGASTLVEEFILGHRSDALEVKVTLDWREQAHLLKLRFPLGVDDPVSTYEIPFAALEHPVDGKENPAQSWVDVSGDFSGRRAGLALVTDAKHGYDVSPADGYATTSIGVTAVRSPVYAWHDPLVLDPKGIYVYQDQGVQRFRYLLVPHEGNWRQARLHRRAAELGTPVRAMLESFHPGVLAPQTSYLHDGGGQVMITALKSSEDPGEDGGADVIVRAVESTGHPGRARLELALTGHVIEADFGPYQIRTFKVPANSGPVIEVNLIEWDLPEEDRGKVKVEALSATAPGAEVSRPDVDDADAASPGARYEPAQRDGEEA